MVKVVNQRNLAGYPTPGLNQEGKRINLMKTAVSDDTNKTEGKKNTIRIERCGMIRL